MKKIFIIFFTCFITAAFASNSNSNNAVNNAINDKNDKKIQEYVQKIEQFFNELKTFQADFIEINTQGWQSYGKFVFKRFPAPSMKMDYLQPATRVITVKNNKVIYYDKELKEKSETSMYSSPLSFLMDFKIDLRKNVDVLALSENNGLISIAFRKKGDIDNEYGSVVLTFSAKPFQLVKWEIYRRSDQMDIEQPIQIFLKNQKINQISTRTQI